MRWSRCLRLDHTFITICRTLPTVCDDIISILSRLSVCLSVCRRYVRIFYMLVYSVVCMSIHMQSARVQSVCLSVGGMRGFSICLYTLSSVCVSTCRAHVSSVWKKYYLLVIFCTATDGVIIISSDSEEDPDGPQTDEEPIFFFPGDSRQHAANVFDDAARQRDPGAAAST